MMIKNFSFAALFVTLIIVACSPKKEVTTTVYAKPAESAMQKRVGTQARFAPKTNSTIEQSAATENLNTIKEEKTGSAQKAEKTVAKPKIKIPENLQWEKHLIPKGMHYATSSALAFWPSETMNFYLRFDSTTIYTTVDSVNQYDWNKVMGFSDCNSMHHQNSVRLVWRYTEEKAIELGGYAYNKGKRSFKTITSISIDEVVLITINANKKKYIISVNDASVELSRGCTSRFISYQLFPYFGGDEVAPRDIAVYTAWVLAE